MLKKIFFRFSILILFLTIFSAFIFYNYNQAQKGLAEYRPGEVSITLDSYPQTISLSSSKMFNIDWSVSAPAGMTTPFTTIYYAAESSPSALTVKDSPQAVAYANHISDYTQGEFTLPDTFSARMTPLLEDKPATIFFRAYAKVGGSHYWTDEYQLTLTP